MSAKRGNTTGRIDNDPTARMCHKIWVEKEGFGFLVNVEYESIPLFCSHCHSIGHSFTTCKSIIWLTNERLIR